MAIPVDAALPRREPAADGPEPKRDRGIWSSGGLLVLVAALAWVALLTGAGSPGASVVPVGARPSAAGARGAGLPGWDDPRAPDVPPASGLPRTDADRPGQPPAPPRVVGPPASAGPVVLRESVQEAPAVAPPLGDPASKARYVRAGADPAVPTPGPPRWGGPEEYYSRPERAGDATAAAVAGSGALLLLWYESPLAAAPAAAARGALPVLLPLLSFLAVWGLVVLAVVLPAAVPTLATYGAAHRASFGTRHAAPHAALFALAAAGLWLLTGVLVFLMGQAVGAAAAASPAVAVRTPYLLALGLAAVAIYRLSAAHEACSLAARRPAPLWVRRAAPGYRGTLAVGWGHAVASVGVGAGPVTVLVVGAAAPPWAIAVAVLLTAERALRRPERIGLVAAGVFAVLALLAAVWPAGALAALGGAPPLPPRRAQPAAAVPAPALLRTVDGQAGEVTALAFSSDGALLASGGWDQDVLLWDVGTGRNARTLGRRGLPRGDDGAVSSIVFTRAGAAVAAGRTTGAVTLWEAATGRELRTLRGPAVAALAFSPDGRTLVAGHADGTAAFWEVSRGRQVRMLRAQESPVDALAFAPGGTVLATGGRDGSVKLWDSASGRELRSFAPGYPVRCLAFSPDGSVLAAGGEEGATLWQVARGGELLRLEHTSTAAVLAFSPDGAEITSAATDGAVRSWAVATGQPMGVARTPMAALVAFAPRPGVLASADVYRRGDAKLVESTVRLWDVGSMGAPGRR